MQGIALGFTVGIVIGAAIMAAALLVVAGMARAEREAREFIGPRPTLYAVPDHEQAS